MYGNRLSKVDPHATVLNVLIQKGICPLWLVPTLGFLLVNCGSSDSGEKSDSLNRSWDSVTTAAAGAVQNGHFRIDPQNNLVAVVDNKVSQWNGSGWDILAEADLGTEILHFDLDQNDSIFTLIKDGEDLKIVERFNDAWTDRTIVDPKFTAFKVKGSNIYAIVGDAANGAQIKRCDLLACVDQTPIANIGLSDFDCNDCSDGSGGGGGGGDSGSGGRKFFAELSGTVATSINNQAWEAITVKAAGMGEQVESEGGRILVQINDQVASYDKTTEEFENKTKMLTDMTHFEFSEDNGTWYGLADGVIWEFNPTTE